MNSSTPGQQIVINSKGDAHIVTVPDLNLSPFAHETSSVEAAKGGKFREVYYMDISFLQLPSHICPFCFGDYQFESNSRHFQSESNKGPSP